VCGTHGHSLQATPAAVTTTLDDFGINCELQYFSYSTKNSLTFSDPFVASSTTDDLVVLIVQVSFAVLRSLWLWYAECQAWLMIIWRNAIGIVMTASRRVMQSRRTILQCSSRCNARRLHTYGMYLKCNNKKPHVLCYAYYIKFKTFRDRHWHC